MMSYTGWLRRGYIKGRINGAFRGKSQTGIHQPIAYNEVYEP